MWVLGILLGPPEKKSVPLTTGPTLMLLLAFRSYELSRQLPLRNTYVHLYVCVLTNAIPSYSHTNSLQPNILTSTRKTTKHQISTISKLLWRVKYRRYVFHVVTVGIFTESSKKHSWGKKCDSETNLVHATTEVSFIIQGSKGTHMAKWL